MSRRAIGRAVVAMLGLSGLLLGSIAAPASAGHGHASRFPDRIELPDGFQPEGIAIGAEPVAYLGSLANGDIYRADLRTGKGRIISAGPGTPSVGLKLDKRDRLFVAGGPAGDARVINARTGRVLKSYQLSPGGSFINDVVLTPDAAWFTDSFKPVLYKVPLGKHGSLPPASEVVTLPLTGDYQHQSGFNVNGIARTPDRQALIIVQSATGLLFRVDPRTGVTRQIDLGGVPMTSGDGLLLVGRTLYVVQNFLNQVAVVKLDRRGTEGRVAEKRLTSPDFAIPTTAAVFGKRLYLPNARFDTPPTAETPYWVTAVKR